MLRPMNPSTLPTLSDLESRLAECMLADRHPLQRKLREAREARKLNKPLDRLLQELAISKTLQEPSLNNTLEDPIFLRL